MRLGRAAPIRGAAGSDDCHSVLGRPAGIQDIRRAGLWALQLSGGLLFAPIFLAWRMAAMESLLLLRTAVSGAIQHVGSLSALFVLPVAAVDLGVGSVLPLAHFSGWNGNVFSCGALDRFARGRRASRGGFCLQRSIA